jgi:phage baseplate assembly protein W
MAFNLRQIFPNDLKPRVAIGFDLPINGNAVFTSNYQTRDAIKNNLINYFLTNPGERPGNPEYGGGLRRFIFSQIEQDNLEFLQEDIQNKLSVNFPNIILEKLQVLESPDNNTVTVNITYSIPNTGINDQLELNFN